MDIGMTNEQLGMFVKIIQMAALLDESVEKYLAEYYSLCDDEKEIADIMRKVKGLESACAIIEKNIKNNSSANKPKIDRMTEKFHEIKNIRNYIAHDRRLLIVTATQNIFPDNGLINPRTELRDMTIDELYVKANELFGSFKDFLGLLYYEPDEEEFVAQRRSDLYGK